MSSGYQRPCASANATSFVSAGSTSGRTDWYSRQNHSPFSPSNSRVHSSTTLLSKPGRSSWLPRRARLRRFFTWGHMKIVSPIVLAGATSLAHHVLLSLLSGTPVRATLDAEFWIRTANNALSLTVSLLLSSSITASFTHMLWYFLRRQSFHISSLDIMFSPPAFLSLLRLLVSRVPFVPMVSFILMISVIEALALVSVAAPNALSTAAAPRKNTTLVVPTLDLNSTDPSSETQTLVMFLMPRLVADGVLHNSPPSGCGLACNYTLEFYSRTFVCSDVDPADISTGSQQGNATLQIDATNGTCFNASTISNFSNPNVPDAIASEFTFVYLPSTTEVEAGVHIANSTPVGTRCVQKSGFFRSYFSFNTTSGEESVTTVIDTYDEPIYQQSNDSVGGNNYYTWVTSIISSFTQAMQGDLDINTLQATTLGWESILNISFAGTFDGNLLNCAVSPLPGVSANLSEAMTQLFTNSTLNLIPLFGTKVAVSGSVFSGELDYAYQPHVLWLVYGLALGAASACAVVGLVCLQVDGVVGSTSFSQILVTTRSRELDVLVGGSPSALTGSPTKRGDLRLEFGELFEHDHPAGLGFRLARVKNFVPGKELDLSV